MVECLASNQIMRVRFTSPALIFQSSSRVERAAVNRLMQVRILSLEPLLIQSRLIGRTTGPEPVNVCSNQASGTLFQSSLTAGREALILKIVVRFHTLELTSPDGGNGIHNCLRSSSLWVRLPVRVLI